MHDNFWFVLSDAIVKMSTQFALSYVLSRPESECVLMKDSVGHSRSLLRPEHQLDMSKLLSTFTAPGNPVNKFLTRLLSCTTATLVHVNVLTSQGVYHAAVPPVYVD